MNTTTPLDDTSKWIEFDAETIEYDPSHEEDGTEASGSEDTMEFDATDCCLCPRYHPGEVPNKGDRKAPKHILNTLKLADGMLICNRCKTHLYRQPISREESKKRAQQRSVSQKTKKRHTHEPPQKKQRTSTSGKTGPITADVFVSKLGKNPMYIKGVFNRLFATKQFEDYTSQALVRTTKDFKGMTKENICYELRGLFKRQPRVVVEWLLRSDEPRSMFFSQLERENKKKIEKFQYNLIEKLQLTRQQAFKTLKPILEELETIIEMDLFGKPSKVFNGITQQRKRLRELAGLKYQVRNVNEKRVLVAWLDLAIFFKWWRSLKTVKETFVLPNDILLVGRFLDGFPMFRWSMEENGEVQLCLKLLNCPRIADSALVTIPIARYRGPEKYEHISVCFGPVLEQLNYYENNIIDCGAGETMKLLSTEISDGASRRTTSSSGNVKLNYPIPNLPIPKSQLGNFLLLVDKVEWTLKDKEELAKRWERKEFPGIKTYSKEERHKLTDEYYGFGMLPPLVKKEPALEGFGFGHADNGIFRKLVVKLFEVAFQYGDYIDVSKFFFGKIEKSIDKLKMTPPQMTGERVKRISKKFNKILRAFKHPTIMNILADLVYSLSEASYIALGHPDGSSEEFWWSARLFFVLYVTTFRESEATPSLTEFCLVGHLHMELFEKLAKEAGLWEPPFQLRSRYFVEWSCESYNSLSSKQMRKNSNNKVAKPKASAAPVAPGSNAVSEINDPEYSNDMILGQYDSFLATFADDMEKLHQLKEKKEKAVPVPTVPTESQSQRIRRHEGYEKPPQPEVVFDPNREEIRRWSIVLLHRGQYYETIHGAELEEVSFAWAKKQKEKQPDPKICLKANAIVIGNWKKVVGQNDDGTSTRTRSASRTFTYDSASPNLPDGAPNDQESSLVTNDRVINTIVSGVSKLVGDLQHSEHTQIRAAASRNLQETTSSGSLNIQSQTTANVCVRSELPSGERREILVNVTNWSSVEVTYEEPHQIDDINLEFNIRTNSYNSKLIINLEGHPAPIKSIPNLKAAPTRVRMIIPFNGIHAIDFDQSTHVLGLNLRWFPSFEWKIRGTAPPEYIQAHKGTSKPNPFRTWQKEKTFYSPHAHRQLENNTFLFFRMKQNVDLVRLGEANEYLKTAIDRGAVKDYWKQAYDDEPGAIYHLGDIDSISIDPVLVASFYQSIHSLFSSLEHKKENRIPFLKKVRGVTKAFKVTLVERAEKKNPSNNNHPLMVGLLNPNIQQNHLNHPHLIHQQQMQMQQNYLIWHQQQTQMQQIYGSQPNSFQQQTFNPLHPQMFAMHPGFVIPNLNLQNPSSVNPPLLMLPGPPAEQIQQRNNQQQRQLPPPPVQLPPPLQLPPAQPVQSQNIQVEDSQPPQLRRSSRVPKPKKPGS